MLFLEPSILNSSRERYVATIIPPVCLVQRLMGRLPFSEKLGKLSYSTSFLALLHFRKYLISRTCPSFGRLPCHRSLAWGIKWMTVCLRRGMFGNHVITEQL